MKFRKIFSIMATLCSISAHAQTGGTVGGGDAWCAEFYKIATEITNEMVKAGQEGMSKVNPLINVSVIRERLKKLKVTPATNLDRQALTDFVKFETKLDVLKWQQLSITQKTSLVSHELMVLTEAESDGSYVVSSDLIDFLRTTRVGLRLKARSYTINNDSSVSFIEPIFTDSHGKAYAIAFASDADAVCRMLGYTQALATKGRKSSLDLNWVKIDSTNLVSEITAVGTMFRRMMLAITCK